ncbi:MAG: hypothetical protein PHW04_06890 [Candidatus Wallbacteria bacterium]|nr:hypothetical protein [Candidatus Wallbacteria bacterium]
MSKDKKKFVVFLGNTHQDVESIVRSDPFIVNRYYQSYEIHELIEGNENNNWLLE